MVEDGCVDGRGEFATAACVEDIRVYGSTLMVLGRLVSQCWQEKYIIQGVKRPYVPVTFGGRGLSVCWA